MKPQYSEGSQYEFLGVQVKGRTLQAFNEPNIKWRDLLLTFYYGPETACDAEPNAAGQKAGLMTASGLTSGAVSVPGLPANFGGFGNAVNQWQPQGFMSTVMQPLLNALSIRWVNNGVQDRWIDVPTDPYQLQGVAGVNPGAGPVHLGVGAGLTISTTVIGGPPGQVTAAAITNVAPTGTGYAVGDTIAITTTSPGTILTVLTVGPGGALNTTNGSVGITTAPLASATAAVNSATTELPTYGSVGYNSPTGDGLVTGNSLPLDNNVTVRRYTAVRGKSWRGNVRPAPIAASQVASTDNDELSSAAAALWKLFAQAMYLPISDGESVLYPLLMSVTESQIVRSPTMIGYAPLVLPGVDPVNGVVNPLVDLALGESRRRKERKTVVV
jgi:hypothetical protein